MPLQFTTIPEQDFGNGIDKQSAENAIPQGFVESLTNVNPSPEGYLAKRVGYQGYAGYLPIRVTKVEQTTSPDELCFFLDSSVSVSSVDLSRVRSSPIVVYGRTSISTSGDFDDSADIGRYYSAFTSDTRKVFLTGTNTLTILQPEHGFFTDRLFVTPVQSTSTTDNSNTLFLVDSITIDSVTFDVTITYTNNSGSSFQGFVIIQDKSSVPGTTYNHTPVTVASGVTSTTTILAGTHGLNNFNILVRAFQDAGTTMVEVIPDLVTINPSGDVAVTLTNNSGVSIDFVYILTAAPVSNVMTGSVVASSTQTIEIFPLLTDFTVVKCYLEQTLGGTREEVIPESVVTNLTDGSTAVTFTNNMTTAANFFVYYEYANVNSNKICVTPYTTGVTFSDSRPQLTIWGLNHDEIYGPEKDETRAGWVNHVDSYRSAGENRVVSGLGGNLFSALERTAIGTAYLLPILYPRLRNRVSVTLSVGPAFVESSDVSTRTRGYIQMDGAGEGWAKGVATSYDSGTGWVRYTLNCPNLTVNGTLSTIVSSTAGLEDILTVQQAGWEVNQGSFKIKQITNPSADTLYIWVENSLVSSSDYDETDSGMEIGVFSDRLTLTSTAEFIPADRILSDLFDDTTVITVERVSGTTIVLSGFTELTEVPAGLRVVGQRSTSRIIPLRTLDEMSTVEDVVAGDMLTFSQYSRLPKTLYINTASDISVSITGNGTDATVTLMSGDTTSLALGQYVLLSQAGEYSGEHQVTAIPSDTTFEFASVETSTLAGTLVGKTIQIDEAFLWQDTVGSSYTVSVDKRWIPVEAPDDNYSLTPSTYISHFDSLPYSNQPFLRSVMVADNMYLTDYYDSVTKYDGANLYRAGLPRWQPHLFVTTDTSPATGGEISISVLTSTVTAVSGYDFSINVTDSLKFKISDIIQHSSDSEIYQILSISNPDTSNVVKISVDRTISSATPGTISKTVTYKYYFRLNAVDANNNVIATAPCGSEDFRIVLGQNAQVRIRLVGLPAWDIYDYDRLEVQIYRTKGNSPAPFYLLTTLQMQFDNGNGYIDYQDAASDDTLLEEELDAVSTVLKGAELGLGWTLPLRAKYITTSGNKLILANVTGYQELNINLVDKGTPITPAVLAAGIYTLRRDNNNTSNITNMVDVARYEFRNAGAITITPAANIVNNAGVSFTVTSAAHGAVAGNWVYMYHSAIQDGNELQYAGWFQIASVNVNDFTILLTHSASYAPSADDVDRILFATDKRDIPVWLGTDGNLSMRNGNRSALVDFDSVDAAATFEFFAMRRLANAINASMRVSTTTGFTPWIIAEAGSEFNAGQLILRQPKTSTLFIEVQLPTFTGYNIFVNQILRTTGAQISAQTLLFPSRILVSYSNYPEIFDSPTVTVDTESDSAIDINPADGQEITSVIPFFGDSAFGAAQQDGIVVVFKTNSIYLVNLAAKAQNQNPVQRIESQGLGCTAPFSVTVTRDGIMFANESGIYRLTRNLTVEYVGQKLDRLWSGDVQRTQDALAVMQGHHYPLGRQYKLSVVPTSETAASLPNSDVLVYNHTREYKGGMGSWTTYDNHPATGWCNLQNDAFMATTRGQVFSVRRIGDTSDYRDDAAIISAEAILRATDFGDGGIRKSVQTAVLHFRNVGLQLSTSVFSAANMLDNFLQLDQVQLFKSAAPVTDLSDNASQKIQSLRFSVDDRKIQYIQLKITNDGYDEAMQLSRVDYRVSGLSTEGISQAKNTTR